jgi:predicted nucleic acid-binding Zn ribbon protein
MERAGRLIGKMKLPADVADPEARARAAWVVAAGPKIANRTRATSLVRGSLIVEVEDHVWQRQLNTLRHFLLRNMRDALGDATVTEIDFRPMPRRRAPQRAETARPQVEGIEDPVLGMLYNQSRRREQA